METSENAVLKVNSQLIDLSGSIHLPFVMHLEDHPCS